MIYSGPEVVESLTEMGISHVVTLPDSTLGTWEPAIQAAPDIEFVRVCREGEAWSLAAGLFLGGVQPLVMIQCTGLFESGDALRNALHDYKLPLFAVIGYRSYLSEKNLPGDSARVYTEPILNAWRIDYRLIDEPAKRPLLKEHYFACRDAGRAGAVLIAEGRA